MLIIIVFIMTTLRQIKYWNELERERMILMPFCTNSRTRFCDFSTSLSLKTEDAQHLVN